MAAMPCWMACSLGLPKPGWAGRVAPVERYALMPYTPIDRAVG